MKMILAGRLVCSRDTTNAYKILLGNKKVTKTRYRRRCDDNMETYLKYVKCKNVAKSYTT
jgi:hypothetical protein